MKFVDFFAGIGGFRTAFEREGFECVAFCEKDKHATNVYKACYNTENEVYYNDATTIIPESMPDFDIFTGGFPCQAFSIAGKRQGFADSRGTLFFEIARICEAKKPKYIVLENVKGLLNHESGRTFATIIGILSDIGYTVEWQVLNSKFFGVPQNRERVFIVGHLGGCPPRKIFPIEETAGFHTQPDADREKIHNIASTMTARQYASWNGNFIYQKPRGKNIGGLKEEAPTVSASSYEHNNFVVFDDYNQNFPKDQNNIGTLTQNIGSSSSRNGIKIAIKEATQLGYAVAEQGDSINLQFPNSTTRRGRVGKGVAQTIETSCNQGTFDGYRIRRLTPLECFRLQGFPDEMVQKAYEIGISDSQLYKMAGNSVTVNVVQEIAKRIKEAQ